MDEKIFNLYSSFFLKEIQDKILWFYLWNYKWIYFSVKGFFKPTFDETQAYANIAGAEDGFNYDARNELSKCEISTMIP